MNITFRIGKIPIWAYDSETWPLEGDEVRVAVDEDHASYAVYKVVGVSHIFHEMPVRKDFIMPREVHVHLERVTT